MTVAQSADVWAVLPVKAFSCGKSRLGPVLSAGVRSAFAHSLFEHVMQALEGVTRIAGVVVVTTDAQVTREALALGAQVVADPPDARLSDVVDAGLNFAAQRGARAAFVCMADLPLMQPSDVDLVLDALDQHDIVIVPDLHEAGTNVLCLSPPQRIGSCFGRVDSFAQHVARAQTGGHRMHVLRAQGLCFDVDGPEDLERLYQPMPA